ncbi:MAG: hypothetical protein GDA42_05985 [Ekhidna sp.]|nr:hypothetical protein [Ekhidna sp.]
MKPLIVLHLVILIGSCQKLPPESAAPPHYPDIHQIYETQIRKLHGRSLIKKASLDSESEKRTFSMDSTEWKDELSFLAEINPDQPEYTGVFDVEESNEVIRLKLKESENSILKKLVITLSGDDYQSISAILHEDKDVYTHHRELLILLDNGLISSFEMSGYRKMVFRDTVWFGIKGIVSE